MSTFEQCIKQDTPRLVVMYKRDEDGKGENFQWGITPGMPMPALLGYISRVQVDIINQLAEAHNECPQLALVIAWNGEDTFAWWIHRDIPADSIVGMLEVVKSTLINGKMGQVTASQRVQLLGPDGKPMRY